MPRIIAIGETMLELSAAGDGGWRLGLGGDTFNTAVHCARMGADVAYVTALGRDPFSDDMLRRFDDEGVSSELVLRDDTRMPGLYAIKTDDEGERSFFYWRRDSAARALFALPGVEAGLDAAATADLLYLSGITLSLYDRPGRERLADVAAAVRRAGGLVAFDPNYRPSGWADAQEARLAIDGFARHVDIALPTFDDERGLHGDNSVRDTVDRWRALGVDEIAVKVGADGCVVTGHPDVVAIKPKAAVRAVDSTGAGDSFNAAYLFARLAGRSASEAAQRANALAGWVLGYAGAIGPSPTNGQPVAGIYREITE